MTNAIRRVLWTMPLWAFVLGVASAEAADVKLTLYSDPVGATVYDAGRVLPSDFSWWTEHAPGAAPETWRRWGIAPVTLKWPVPRHWTECLTTYGMRVRWASGAEATLPSIRLCPQPGKEQQVTFMRPTGVPGADVDAQFAAQLLLLQQAQTPPPVVYVPPPKALYCTSQIIGWQVFTHCY